MPRVVWGSRFDMQGLGSHLEAHLAVDRGERLREALAPQQLSFVPPALIAMWSPAARVGVVSQLDYGQDR